MAFDVVKSEYENGGSMVIMMVVESWQQWLCGMVVVEVITWGWCL